MRLNLLTVTGSVLIRVRQLLDVHTGELLSLCRSLTDWSAAMTVGKPLLPFGLAVAAREPISVDDVDPAVLIYDGDRQVMLVRDGGLVPWCRHSTGKTNTNSNTDGQGGPETDEDYTED